MKSILIPTGESMVNGFYYYYSYFYPTGGNASGMLGS
ncbi:hypothetical protein SBDP1_520019 [Syntrophobacter sp. SbD1]|nr:hypothetical protein SBDP1_520019 [Syntrophobacter sp. SbD1]